MFYVNLVPFLVFFAIPFSYLVIANRTVMCLFLQGLVCASERYLYHWRFWFSILIQIVVNLNGRFNRDPDDFEDDTD